MRRSSRIKAIKEETQGPDTANEKMSVVVELGESSKESRDTGRSTDNVQQHGTEMTAIKKNYNMRVDSKGVYRDGQMKYP